MDTTDRRRTWVSRVAWFVGLWALSIGALGVASICLKLVMAWASFKSP